MEDIEDELLDFLVDLSEKKEPLGEEFEKIINDNIDVYMWSEYGF